MKHSSILITAALAVAFVSLPKAALQARPHSPAPEAIPGKGKGLGLSFQRVATFPVIDNYCEPGSPRECFERAVVAEIIAVSEDGRLLIYTDSANQEVGFVDITDPTRPVPGGTLGVGGEPTSVAVAGKYALVAVNTSPSFVAPSGHLTVIDIHTRTIVPGAEALPLGGQPDAIAVSPNKRYAAIAIENERDEDLGSGAPPQLPPGKLVRVELSPPTDPTRWRFRDIDLTGIAHLFPEDPEPEFVDINHHDIAAVTLQENNHILLVDLKTCVVVGDFSAGTVDLVNIDTAEEGVINFDSVLSGVPREPDAVAWISNDLLATADEGDLNGGSRGFTVFDTAGTVVFTSGSDFEHLAGSIGHYPEDRSANKGSEPEGVEYGKYGPHEFLFVGSERGSFVGVYRLANGVPELAQVLPTAVSPEGLLAIPSRDLFVATGEVDDNEDQTFRASISIYQLRSADPAYPTIVSEYEPDGTPVPWAALSGLAAHPADSSLAYSVSDSFFATGFIYPMDISVFPALIKGRIEVTGAADLDLEGVAVRSDGSLWLASEGNAGGTRTNRLLAVDQVTGALLLPAVELPPSVHARRTGNGFEGVAVTGSAGAPDEAVYVAFQREWGGDPAGKVRIGVYHVATATWGFLYYPLDAVTSPNGGWVGLSELTSLGGGSFAVIERDNQAGANARIKRIYRFSVAGLEPQPDCAGTCDFPTVVKTVVRDLIPNLQAPAGAIIEKVEGLAVTANGRTFVHTDNDGVDGSNGETQLIDLGYGVLP